MGSNPVSTTIPQIRLKNMTFNKYQKWKNSNPDSYNRQVLKMRERYRALRAAAFDKLGGRCKECGLTDTRVLTIDHVNGGGHEHRQTGRGKLTSLYKDVIEGTCEQEVQLLCANCHAIKTYMRE